MEWSAALEAALMASRRDDLQHGTTAAHVRGCVCIDQSVRMGRKRG